MLAYNHPRRAMRLLLFALLPCPPAAGRPVAAAARPNVVFILIDDLRWDALGLMGHPFARPGFDHWVSFKGQGVYNDPPLNVDGRQEKAAGYMTDLLSD